MARGGARWGVDSRLTVVDQRTVADHLGISQQAVAQTERRALEKCKARCAQRGLHFDDLLREARGRHWSDEEVGAK